MKVKVRILDTGKIVRMSFREAQALIEIGEAEFVEELETASYRIKRNAMKNTARLREY